VKFQKFVWGSETLRILRFCAVLTKKGGLWSSKKINKRKPPKAEKATFSATKRQIVLEVIQIPFCIVEYSENTLVTVT